MENSLNSIVYLIRDNAKQFNLNYLDYGIKEIRTSIKAPNMNSIAERFVGSARREALDFFLIFGEKQLLYILNQYIAYYNSLRPHQGINQEIPKGYEPRKEGNINSKSILGGLHHHYYRDAA